MTKTHPLPMGLDIRRMGVKDIRDFVRLRREIESGSKFMPTAPGERRDSFLYNLIKHYVNRDKVFTYVAYKDGELVGYLVLLVGRFRKFRGNAYVANVSVKKSFRGHGIGTMLMDVAEKAAKERRARRVELEVFAKNERAWQLYEKLGYVIEGRKRKAVENEDGYDDLIFMAKFI